jgi:Tfp pilus assembly protein PilF
MKNIFKLALIAQLILVGCGSSSKEKDNNLRRSELHFSHGTEALVNKEYTTALDHLMKANALRPNQSKILNNLGMAFYFKKELARALKNLLLSLKADPKNSDARTNLASVYVGMNKLNEAEEHYNIVLKDLIYKHQYRVHYNLALVEQKRGNYDKSIVQLKKAIEVKDDYCPANFKLGNLAFRRYDYQSALKYYKDATKGSCYNLAEPHLRQAEAMIQLKKYTEARLKLTDVKNQFKGTRYDTLAKVKLNDLDNLEKQEFYSTQNQINNNFYNK